MLNKNNLQVSKKDQCNVVKELIESSALSSEFYIMSMLAYQFRVLLIIRAGLDAGLNQQVIAREGKLHPFVVQKNSQVAGQASLDFWRDALTKIMATDVAIKQGRIDARTGLLMLVNGFLQ